LGKEERVQLLIRFGYDGSRFYGLAPQPDVPTAAGALRARLEEASGGLRARGLAFTARTDRGVHAEQNFATCYFIEEVFQTDTVVETLLQEVALDRDDGLLHVEARQVPWNVHARAIGMGKHYRYRLGGGYSPELIELVAEADRRPFGTPCPVDPALLDIWQVHPPLNAEWMRRAAAHLVGTHDFSSFRGGPIDNRPPVRTVTDIFITDFGDEVVVDVFGHGFLRKMVRIIVGTLAEVGVGMRHPDSMPRVLARRNRRAAGLTAPARGLTLMAVETEEPWFDEPLPD
jgi:tRNA pseudouridine38-40 synthase